MRKLLGIAVVALIVAACGGNAEPASTAAPTPSETIGGASQDSVATTSTAATAEPPTETTASSESTEASGPSFDGPLAPDFELALNDGSTFRLSDEAKPIYMVFWAEW